MPLGSRKHDTNISINVFGVALNNWFEWAVGHTAKIDKTLPNGVDKSAASQLQDRTPYIQLLHLDVYRTLLSQDHAMHNSEKSLEQGGNDYVSARMQMQPLKLDGANASDLMWGEGSTSKSVNWSRDRFGVSRWWWWWSVHTTNQLFNDLIINPRATT
jgi:hypothetical protein